MPTQSHFKRYFVICWAWVLTTVSIEKQTICLPHPLLPSMPCTQISDAGWTSLPNIHCALVLPLNWKIYFAYFIFSKSFIFYLYQIVALKYAPDGGHIYTCLIISFYLNMCLYFKVKFMCLIKSLQIGSERTQYAAAPSLLLNFSVVCQEISGSADPSCAVWKVCLNLKTYWKIFWHIKHFTNVYFSFLFSFLPGVQLKVFHRLKC